MQLLSYHSEYLLFCFILLVYLDLTDELAMRSLLRAATAAVAASSAVVALQDSSRPSWSVSTLGIVRFGRAAIAVGTVMMDYKWTFYNMDHDSEIYLQTRSQVKLN